VRNYKKLDKHLRGCEALYNTYPKTLTVKTKKFNRSRYCGIARPTLPCRIKLASLLLQVGTLKTRLGLSARMSGALTLALRWLPKENNCRNKLLTPFTNKAGNSPTRFIISDNVHLHYLYILYKSVILQSCFQLAFCCTSHGTKRKPELLLYPAHHAECGLNRHRICLKKHGVT
jgi:hypothetical protein